MDMTKPVTLLTVGAVMIKFLVNQLPNLSLIGLDVLCQTGAPPGLALGFTPGQHRRPESAYFSGE